MTDANPRSSALPPPVDWTRVTKVLLIRLRSIGDTVLMMPCVKALKDWQPAVRVSVVIEPLSAPVLEGHPLIDQLFIIDKTFASKRGLVATLRHEKYDLAFNLHGGTTGMFLTARCGAGRSFGYRRQRGSWMLTDRAPGPDVILQRQRIHSVEQQLALLHWARVPIPEQPSLDLSINPHDETGVREKLLAAGLQTAKLISSRFAIVAPGAAFESKRWSAEKFAAVIDHLGNRRQIETIILAGPGQESLATAVAGLSTSHPAVLCGIGLGELKALIGVFGRIFVGNDSGPMHIAAALGCPLVAVFGSSNPDVWHPWTTSPYRVLGGERGTADSEVRDTIDRVRVEEVISAVDQVLESAAGKTAS